MSKAGLHWLPLRYRIEYKLLLFTYKTQNGTAPIYLTDLLMSYTPTRTLRSGTQQKMEQPRINMKKYGERSFSAAVPLLWNALPMDIKKSQTVDCFKSRLKTHLYRKAFNVV